MSERDDDHFELDEDFLAEQQEESSDFDRIITMTERVAFAAFGNRLGL